VPWIVLLVSAVFEAVWATALGQSNGFSELVPSIVFFVALAISMGGLGWAVKSIPIGTAYAVWVGIGAALTVSYAILTGDESASVGKVVFIAGIILAVVGLKLVPHGPSKKPAETAATTPDAPATAGHTDR
jgi:quaternary ammonium compound-resistance protein SugE